MSSGGDSEVVVSSSYRKPRPSPSKALPQLFVEKEADGGLRYRHSSSNSPPLVTSTPTVKLGYLGQQFVTPTKGKSKTVNIDSGYGGLSRNNTHKKFDSNLDGSYIGNYISDSPLANLASFVTSPVVELRRRWRGRQSFLEPGQTRLGGKLVQQVEPQHVLAWLMVSVVLISLGFVLLVSLTQNRGSPRDRLIQFGNEKMSGRPGDEGRIVESVTDEEGIRLGGKKAAIQFVHDKLGVSDSLDQDGVRDFYDDFDEGILKRNLNPPEMKTLEVAQSSPEILSMAVESDPGYEFSDPQLKRRNEINSKLKSFRSLPDVPVDSYRPRSGKVLFKVKDISSETEPFVAVAGEPADTILALEDSSASEAAEKKVEKDDNLPYTISEKKANSENPSLIKLNVQLPESRSASRRKTKHRNPLLKQIPKDKMSKAKKSLKVLPKDRVWSANDGNVDNPLKSMENEAKEMRVKEGINIILEEAAQRKESPVMIFPDDPSFRKRNKREIESGGESNKAEPGDNGFRRRPVENIDE